MYYKLNLNKLSSKQIQKKTGKIHKKMSEEHCNTLPTIGLGRPARRMGASKEAAEANAPPIQPKAILANPAQRPNI